MEKLIFKILLIMFYEFDLSLMQYYELKYGKSNKSKLIIRPYPVLKLMHQTSLQTASQVLHAWLIILLLKSVHKTGASGYAWYLAVNFLR